MKVLFRSPYDDKNIETKPLWRQYYEMLILFYSLNYLPAEYYSFKFYHKGCTYKEMLHFIPYSWFLNKVNVFLTPASWVKLFENKALFNDFARQKGLNVTTDYGIYNEIYGYDLMDKSRLNTAHDIEQLFRKYNLKKAVIKDLSGTQGRNIYFISDINSDNDFQFKLNHTWISKDDLSLVLKNGEFIIQEYLENDPFFDAIYPNSINTFRIITFLTKRGEVKIIGALLRTGIGQNKVDNYHQGGLVIPVDLESGRFIDYGYNYDCKSFTKHPNTNFQFQGIEIPQWDELIEYVKRCALSFPMMRFLSWDLAYTKNGFIILEANAGSVYVFINQLSTGGFANLIRDDLMELGFEFPSERLPIPGFKDIVSRTWRLAGNLLGFV